MNPNDQINFWTQLANFARGQLLSFLLFVTIGFAIVASVIHAEHAFMFFIYVLAGLSIFLIAFPEKEKAEKEDQEV